MNQVNIPFVIIYAVINDVLVEVVDLTADDTDNNTDDESSNFPRDSGSDFF